MYFHLRICIKYVSWLFYHMVITVCLHQHKIFAFLSVEIVIIFCSYCFERQLDCIIITPNLYTTLTCHTHSPYLLFSLGWVFFLLFDLWSTTLIVWHLYFQEAGLKNDVDDLGADLCPKPDSDSPGSYQGFNKNTYMGNKKDDVVVMPNGLLFLVIFPPL